MPHGLTWTIIVMIHQENDRYRSVDRWRRATWSVLRPTNASVGAGAEWE